VEYYNTIFAFAESPVKAGVFWAGSDDGLVHLSTDNGKNWVNVTPKDLTQECTISTIEPSHFKEGTAYLAARRYRQDDFAPYIYKTTDFGKHWTKITNGLPADQSSFVVREDPKNPNLLFAGTLDGVYVSFNQGKLWQPLRLNLPHVPVRDLAIQQKADEMVLATHGRSIWILDNLSVLRQLTSPVNENENHLFRTDTTYLTKGYGYFSPGMAVGENPANGLVVYYYLNDAAKDKPVRLTFMTSEGDSIISYSSKATVTGKPVRVSSKFYPDTTRVQRGVLPAKPGLNRFVWNLRYPSATRVPGAVLWGGGLAGPHIIPGTYQIKMTFDGKRTTVPFVVVKDPRYAATQSDLEAQFALAMKVHKKLDAVGKAIIKIRKVRKTLTGMLSRTKDFPQHDTLKKAATPLLKELTSIEQALLQTKSHASEDPLNYPVRLSSKLAALSNVISSSYNRPTQQEYEVFKKLSKQTDDQLNKLKPLLRQKLDDFNKLAASLKVPAVYVSKK
jgi:hypothetical protein